MSHRQAQWTDEDDQKLMGAVFTTPIHKKAIDWSRISREADFALPGRTAKACRERYFNTLDPQLNQGPWSEEEDDFIVEMQRLHGNKWAAMARKLDTNRTDHTVKNRFNVLKRIRQIPSLPKAKRMTKAEREAERSAKVLAVAQRRWKVQGVSEPEGEQQRALLVTERAVRENTATMLLELLAADPVVGGLEQPTEGIKKVFEKKREKAKDANFQVNWSSSSSSSGSGSGSRACARTAGANAGGVGTTDGCAPKRTRTDIED